MRRKKSFPYCILSNLERDKMNPGQSRNKRRLWLLLSLKSPQPTESLFASSSLWPCRTYGQKYAFDRVISCAHLGNRDVSTLLSQTDILHACQTEADIHREREREHSPQVHLSDISFLTNASTHGESQDYINITVGKKNQPTVGLISGSFNGFRQQILSNELSKKKKKGKKPL